MTATIRVLGLDRARWERIGPHSLVSGLIPVVAGSGLIALNRFGGAVLDAPRAFVRLALIGVWGWLGLSLAIWLIANAAPSSWIDTSSTAASRTMLHAFAFVGVSHSPLVVLGIVVLVAAGLFQLLGPGFVMAVFVLAFWIPASLTVAVRYAHAVGWAKAFSTVVVPYGLWYSVVGRHLMGQIQHLL